MEVYASDYIFTGSELLKDKAVLLRDGIVLDVGNLKTISKVYPEAKKVEYSGGVLFPGFINTHTHLELSYLKEKLPYQKGFVEWLKSIMNLKHNVSEKRVLECMKNSIDELKSSGVAILGDISNTLLSVDALKEKMPLSVVFYENYSLKKEKACEVLKKLKKIRFDFDMKVSLTPHSIYSSHPCLMKYLCEHGSILSIHFLESVWELSFFEGKGDLYNFLREMDLIDYGLSYSNHWDFLSSCDCRKKGMIFVHCVHAGKEDLDKIREINGTVCLCLRSNDFITGELPNVYGISESGVNVAIGTDSYASNRDLNFLKELSFIADRFPSLKPSKIFQWAIAGGAKALKLNWGFYRGGRAQPIFIPSFLVDPLAKILSNGSKPPEVFIA